MIEGGVKGGPLQRRRDPCPSSRSGMMQCGYLTAPGPRGQGSSEKRTEGAEAGGERSEGVVVARNDGHHPAPRRWAAGNSEDGVE